MQVSNHARERYCERMLGIAPENIRAYLEEHCELVDRAVLDMLHESELVMSREGKDYHLWDIYLLVVAGQTVVTVVKNDYGFDEEMNRKIVQHLREKIWTLQAGLREKENVASERRAAISAQVEAVDAETRRLESELRKMQAVRRQLAAQMEAIEAEMESLKKLIDQEATKLVYPTAYKLEELRNGKKRV